MLGQIQPEYLLRTGNRFGNFRDMPAATSTTIDFSTIETETLGFKIGRCNDSFFDETELYRQITENRYDLCRVKVAAEDEFAPHRLHQTGLPAFFSGSIRRYKTKITEAPSGEYNYPDLVWELYDGSQTELLKNMLVGTWGDYPIGYYRTPYLSELTNKETEIESVFQFYKKHNYTKNYPNNSIVFIKHGENYVGFFALNILNGNLESHVGGILATYRKGGYFLDKLRYIKEYCIKNNLQNFIFGARNENAEVQRIFQYVGFNAIGSENVFHVPALLTATSSTPVVQLFKTSEMDFGKLYGQLYHGARSLAEKHLQSETKMTFQLNYPKLLLREAEVLIRFSVPVATDKEVLVVIRSETEKANQFTGYLRALVS